MFLDLAATARTGEREDDVLVVNVDRDGIAGTKSDVTL
jgi:hypothetical protein